MQKTGHSRTGDSPGDSRKTREYLPTIGLEIHAELKTQTKMFCSSRNDPFAGEANVHVCPVCMAHPGTLPVINREAVKSVLKVGLALGAQLADYTEFDRKNYFYPDLPKGYQLSQYKYPLVSGGELAGVKVTRVHLEEDTASSIHDEERGATVIDYNRAGVPLMELVTEPVVHSAEEAGRFARELQLLLRTLGVSDAHMEKGEMRVEANISVGKNGELGTKVEVKNLNSFRTMERAVAHEIKRQVATLENGEEILQETRGWDESKQATFAQRTKEGSADYRYFPDPDLPSLRLSEIEDFSVNILKQNMPELPWERRGRYEKHGVKKEDADTLTLNPTLADFFDKVVAELSVGVGVQMAANYITNDLQKIIRDIEKGDAETHAEIPISAQNFKKIMSMVGDEKISSRVAKDLLHEVSETGGEPEIIAEKKNLLRVADTEELSGVVERVLTEHASVADEYKNGKASALEFLLGQGMRATRGAADPEALRELIRSKLG